MPKPAINEKVFRDNVHGYIRIPSIIVDEIIDTEAFQRLRHIEQTSMRPLYPAARHDRFIHSLGVFHLGNRAFKAIRRTLPQDLKESLPEPCGEEGWWDKRYYLFILACLLHDCAHAPFSHTLEKYYGLERDANGEFSRLDSEVVNEFGNRQGFKCDFLSSELKGRGAEHEKMSCLLVSRYFRSSIERIFEHLKEIGYLSDDFSTVGDDDVALMARMIIGCPYSSEVTAERSLDNCFISLLNSSSIDVDGLDYTMRDTQSSGMNNWNIDYERLLASLRIRSATRLDECSVSSKGFSGIWLTGSTFKADDENRESCLEINGSFEGRLSDQSDRERFMNLKGVEVFPEGNEIKVDRDEELTVFQNMRQGYEIKTNSSCRVSFDQWSGKVAGVVLKPASVLVNEWGLDDGWEQAYVLSYEKSSISVISGAIEARNSFYRWVYSHPHVQYHASFLQNYLLKMSAKYLCCRKNNSCFAAAGSGDCPPVRCDKSTCSALAQGKPCPGEEEVIFHILGLEGFYNPLEPSKAISSEGDFLFCRSTDDDLNALFKWVYLDNRNNKDKPRSEAIDRYFGEYFARTRKYLLWKSPEDRRHFLGMYPYSPDLVFTDLKGAGNSLLSLDYIFVDERDRKVEFFLKSGCTNLVAINVSQKMKGLDFASTFVSFGGEIERLVDVMAPSSISSKPKEFVYLFSDTPFRDKKNKTRGSDAAQDVEQHLNQTQNDELNVNEA
ncbi:HD domain-containing protein [Adlercreutzia sp. ZJ304]|uniref:HD domain-containing protein n=1 Tax=Adlercreutzia sp. ZJ304 TaxID=2709791 RepID=UPI0013EB8DD4|nr:HD domain-containing protein [Adlercreutzia sp. ZJ304]